MIAHLNPGRNYVAELQITVKSKPLEHILLVACVNRIQDRPKRKPNAPDCDWHTIERLAVNYIRHELTEYDYHCRRIEQYPDSSAAYFELHNKVQTAIAKAYPHFARECARQVEMKYKRRQIHHQRQTSQVLISR